MDIYTVFNIIEGLFWLFAGSTALLLTDKLPSMYKKFLIFVGLATLLFGISDFVEIIIGGFLNPVVWWLLVWKVLGVLGFVVGIVWYLKLRIR